MKIGEVYFIFANRLSLGKTSAESGASHICKIAIPIHPTPM